ncbi:MAG: thiamine pyrophosphate-dependent enzyme [Candidatus Eisenbacteria bacterium]
MPDELITHAENTWCPGCGNFGILNAMKGVVRLLGERGVPRSHVVMAAGIGCHAKIFDYLGLSGFYSLHGRAMATAQGLKLANPDLRVVTFCGDGDAFGEGIAHMMHAAKRNANITVVVHDNGVYALTTGQRTPLSPRGFKGPSTPGGNQEDPWNPLVLMLEAGATFVARAYCGMVPALSEIITEAMMHDGFSFVQVLQPSVTFTNRFAEYNESVKPLEGGPLSFDDALAQARRTDVLPAGIYYRAEKTPYERELLGDRNPVRDRLGRDERLAAVHRLIGG